MRVSLNAVSSRELQQTICCSWPPWLELQWITQIFPSKISSTNSLLYPSPQFQQALSAKPENHKGKQSRWAYYKSLFTSCPQYPIPYSHPHFCRKLHAVASLQVLPPFQKYEADPGEMSPFHVWSLSVCQNCWQSIPRNRFFHELPGATHIGIQEEFSMRENTASTLA